MEPLRLEKIVEVSGGSWIDRESPPGTLVGEVSTDSRTLPKASVFVALRGERFDGHAYVREAHQKGALASIVSEDCLGDLPPSSGPYICVRDTLEALECIARWNRDRLTGLSVVGVTGSVGKTSTKEFLATVLADACTVKCAPKSYNNRIGVATTLISATPETEVLVAELGASAPGELSHLTRIVRPDKVVLTEIAPAHLDGFGDMDGLVAAKAEVFEGLAAGGSSFLRHGVRGFHHFVSLARGPLCTFGWGAGDYAVTDCHRVSLGQDCRSATGRGDYGYVFTLNGEENFLLPVPGRHNVLNAMAAIAVARDYGMSWEQIRSSLAMCRLPPLRLQVLEEADVVFVDDSYNASPLSVQAAIDEWRSLAREADPSDGAVEAAGGCSRRLVAVLGDMLEMGSAASRVHEDIGRYLAAPEPRLLVTVGSESRRIGETLRLEGGGSEVVHFEAVDEALPYLKERIRPGDHVLLKGSRRIGLDSLSRELRKWLLSTTAVAAATG